jgi:hypothetical protein
MEKLEMIVLDIYKLDEKYTKLDTRFMEIETPLCGEESYKAARNTDYSRSSILILHV